MRLSEDVPPCWWHVDRSTSAVVHHCSLKWSQITKSGPVSKTAFSCCRVACLHYGRFVTSICQHPSDSDFLRPSEDIPLCCWHAGLSTSAAIHPCSMERCKIIIPYSQIDLPFLVVAMLAPTMASMVSSICQHTSDSDFLRLSKDFPLCCWHAGLSTYAAIHHCSP